MSFDYSNIHRGTGLRSHRSKDSSSQYWKALKNTIPTFDEQPGLPLYKDKPIGSKDDTIKTKRKKMLFKGTILLIAFYVFYYIGWFLKQELGVDSNYEKDSSDWPQRQERVKQAFKDTWAQYEKNAWGKDVYNPISKKGKNMGKSPLGWIIVDSLDTMLIMGLDEEYKTAESWVANELTYDFDYEVNVFETTIRMLGGLLSAFYLSENDMYLNKATDLADRLLGAFNSPSGLPYASVNLKTGQGVKNHVDNGASSTAEVSTLQLEFKYLAKLTGETLYWEKVENVMKVLDENNPKDGLVPIYVHPDSGKYQGKLIRLGSRGDSYYEYLLKQYLQTEEREPIYNTIYQESLRGIKDHLLKRSKPNGLAFLGELDNGIGGALSNKMDHLVCFVGGLFALGATEGKTVEQARGSSNWDSTKEKDLLLAKEITHTCWKIYEGTATGLAPEIAVFNTNEDSTEDFYIKPLDKHNLQRPETVESLFILWRITKDPIYREWGWKIFQSFEKFTKTSDGSYTSLDDVTKIPPKQRDNMESFWLAETLKYLYLLFDDEEVLPLDKVVFNTEAHPFPVFSMNPTFKTGWSRSGTDSGKVTDRKAGVRESIDEIVDTKQKVIGEEHKGVKPNHEKAVNDDNSSEKPIVNSVPSAAKPAKPAIEELQDSIDKLPDSIEEGNSEIKKKLDEGQNVNEIIEDLIEEEDTKLH